MCSKKYYEAYEERYKKAHAEGIQWFGSESSPIVGEIITKYDIRPHMQILELGCGEGRDAQYLLKNGYNLLAVDISQEAINYCKKTFPDYDNHFKVIDCVNGSLSEKFDFIYAVAVVHMLVPDEDRNKFYKFIFDHLTTNGVALICSMGNGKTERRSDINAAFELQERECRGKKIMVAGTSCRMVNNETFEAEIRNNDLNILETGQTCIPDEFPEMMYAVVKRVN